MTLPAGEPGGSPPGSVRPTVRPGVLSVLRDLAPRAASALVLGIAAVWATWAGPLSFAALVFAVSVIMCWEWSRIVRGDGHGPLMLLHGLAVAAAVVLTAYGAPGTGLAVIAAGTVAMLLFADPAQRPLSAAGVAYVGLPAVAFVWLRGADASGTLAVFFIFAIVWATDVFAYLTGRLVGGPKLWPAISPGKTWSGTIGGIVFAALAAAVFSLLLPRQAPVALAAVAIVLSVVSQAGDLAESALKRAFGVKNSSDLIPGHGGFMDRMDGAVVAAVAAAALSLWRGAGSPAAGLLLWP